MLPASETWSPETFPGIAVVASGRVPMLEGERIAGAVGRLLARYHVSTSARIRITGSNCGRGPILVQVNTHTADTPLRVQTLTHGRGDALPVIVRLERQLRMIRKTWSPRPWPDPTRPPLSAPGPGILVRRKTVAPHMNEPLTAATVLDAMDYDAHLFTDAETGEDSILYRARSSGLRLARQRCVHPPRTTVVGATTVPLITTPCPAPVLTEQNAADRVCGHGLPFLFYTDPDTGRGHLLYRRYDAGLGLIAPAASAATVRS